MTQPPAPIPIIFPENRINAFPEMARPVLLAALYAAITKIQGAAEPGVYQAAFNKELEQWERCQKLFTSRFTMLASLFAPDIDRRLLAVKTVYSQAGSYSELLAEVFECYKTLVMEQTTQRCQELFGTILHTPHDLTPWEGASAESAARMFRRHVFSVMVRPSAHVAFCKRLSTMNLSFNQLLDVYKRFIKSWQTTSEHTVEAAMNTLACLNSIAEPTDLSFVPDTKTAICSDRRGRPVHLKPVDRLKLYRTIPPNTDVLEPITDDGNTNDEVKDGTLLNGTITYSSCARQGRRPAMEDADLIDSFTLSDGTECPLFAIMDGFNQSIHVSHTLKAVLATTVKSWLDAALKEPKDFDLSFRNALKIGMIQLDLVIKSMFDGMFLSPTPAGSTCIFCFIYKNRLFTVNIGDSRAVTSSGQQLNTEAGKDNPDYVRKIEKLGGMVDKGRVDGLLPFSVFGAYYCSFVRASPSIHVLKLKPQENGNPLRLFLSCDGVPDIFTTAHIAKLLNQGKTAQDIVSEAYNNGAEDNLSVIVADIPYAVDE